MFEKRKDKFLVPYKTAKREQVSYPPPTHHGIQRVERIRVGQVSESVPKKESINSIERTKFFFFLFLQISFSSHFHSKALTSSIHRISKEKRRHVNIITSTPDKFPTIFEKEIACLFYYPTPQVH